MAQVKPGKFYCESRRSGECAPMGASSFVVSRRAFQGLTEAAAEDCALFLLPQLEQVQEERMAKGTSEKLAQEGLRGNRDRLAVEACVPHARPVGSRVPRDHTGGSPRARRPPCRPLRIRDNSNRRNGSAFQKRGRGLCLSFLIPQTKQGYCKQKKEIR